MTRALADRITARRASDRLAALNPFNELVARTSAATAPAAGSQPDSNPLPGDAAGAANSDGLDIPSFLDRRIKQ